MQTRKKEFEMNMKLYLFALSVIIGLNSESYAQIAEKDSTSFTWERFTNIFRVEVTYDKPDSSFIEMEYENGFKNKDSIEIKHVLFPVAYEASIQNFKKWNAPEGQTILFKGDKKISDIAGYLIESDNIVPRTKSIYRVLYFVMPHEYGTISMKAVYPTAMDKLYREKILKSFSTVKCRTMNHSELYMDY